MGCSDFKRDLWRKYVTMDLRIFILAITLPIITANILAGNQCDTRGSRVNQVFRNLKAEGESDATIDLLEKEICNSGSHCSVRVRTWWPNMASIVFNQNAFSLICTEMSNKKCAEYIDQIAEALTQTSTLDALVETLQGSAYCAAPKEESLKNDFEIEACQEFVSDFLPKAL